MADLGRPNRRREGQGCRATVDLQDGADKATYTVRELPDGPERDEWWRRAVETWSTYGDYQRRTDRLIPIFLLERAG